MRVWISRRSDALDMCAVWIMLDEDRMLWIMGDGTWGVTLDQDQWNDDVRLSEQLPMDNGWEELR